MRFGRLRHTYIMVGWAALVGGGHPSLALSPEGQHSSAALITQPDGSGALLLTDALGQARFRAP